MISKIGICNHDMKVCLEIIKYSDVGTESVTLEVLHLCCLLSMDHKVNSHDSCSSVSQICYIDCSYVIWKQPD